MSRSTMRRLAAAALIIAILTVLAPSAAQAAPFLPREARAVAMEPSPRVESSRPWLAVWTWLAGLLTRAGQSESGLIIDPQG